MPDGGRSDAVARTRSPWITKYRQISGNLSDNQWRSLIEHLSTIQSKSSLWRGEGFKLREVDHRIIRILATHLFSWAQPPADFRPVRMPEQPAAIVIGELYAADTSGFSVRHSGDWGRN
jgi:hypothetical protein